MSLESALVAHDLLTTGLRARAAGRGEVVREAVRRAERVLVGALATLDLDGSLTAEHLFEVLERATLALARARRADEGRGLDEARGLLAPLAAMATAPAPRVGALGSRRSYAPS